MKLSEHEVLVGVSNRHIHLAAADVAALFGEGHKLTIMKDLGQPGQFACEEVVTIVGPKGSIDKVRVLGPERKQTQIEVSLTDAFKLGINPPIRESGDLAGSASIKVVGPKGEVELKEGAIVAFRHIHMTPADAEKFGVQDKEIVKVYAHKSPRKAILEDVIVRVSPSFFLEFHIDTDEANATLLKTGDYVKLVKE